jgi:RNA polymerase sigma-70 factor (ECF subfamily)
MAHRITGSHLARAADSDQRGVPGDEAALVQAARRGDREAFGTLVSRHARSIISVTARMLGPGADAEDVAQDTFVAAFKALPGFRLDSKFSTWLYRIAINKCTDSLRARRPEVQSLDDDGRDDDSRAPIEPATEETPDWELERVELAWELDKAIEALPRLYRESFVLRHIEDLGYDEMSAILGVHRDTLKMRVYKARMLLCRSLAHLGGVR